ncbi:hypothetical protein HN784_03190 [bacterium]|jgi:hypothetical protein|nr:hypothetical protein [bacterium]MBT4251299.1 hypothetical protein [bacterium]MBT4598320.1 hypothetical protein [bacterium]MBT6754153.1 hypothetical protein [bacterium]MBT7037973.1 hypothetical protein [bacterium]
MRIIAIIVNFSLVFLVGILFLYIIGRIPPSGALGFRPIDDGCYGISLENKEVYGKFPKGRIWIKVLNLEYYVPDKKKNESKEGFCLGKNFWLEKESVDKKKVERGTVDGK